MGVIHPFPTTLVVLATVAIAVLAGGTPLTVAVLGLAMLGFQAAIGATNDLADQAEDRARGAPKPLPAGQISVRAATIVAIASAVVGLGLSALLGPIIVLVGVLGLGCGIAYDLWLRPRGLAIVAYALALPLLLIDAWWGAAETLPPGGLALLALAALAGPGLYLANDLVDVDLDALHQPMGLAARLGQRRAMMLDAVVVATTQLLAWLLWAGTPRPMGAALLMLGAGVLALLGVVLSSAGRRTVRSLGWTGQAVATVLLGVGLVAALADGLRSAPLAAP